MTQLPDQAPRDRRSNLPVVLGALAAIGAAKAAAWFYFRSRQPVTDELTRDRLRRWSDR